MDNKEWNSETSQGSKSNIHINLFIMINDVVRNLVAVVMIAAIIASASYIVKERMAKPSYQSSITFMLSTSDGSSGSLKSKGALVEAIMGSALMKKVIAADLGLESTTVPATITTVIPSEGSIINVTVTAATPKMAFQTAESLTRNYHQVSDYLMEGLVLEVIEPAVIPTFSSVQSSARQLFKRVFLYAFLILIVGVLALSYFRDTVKTEEDMKEKIDTELFATVGRQSRRGQNKQSGAGWKVWKKNKQSILINGIHTSFSFVEAFKKIRTRLEAEHSKNDCKVIMITSVMENEGKSTVAANIALALAQKSDKVLLMDADFRKPAQYKVFDAGKADHGFGDVLMKECTLEDAMRLNEKSGLYCLYNYKTYRNSSELLLSREMTELLKQLRDQMDYIIVDTPPTSMVADAEIVSNLADASLLVVREDCTRIPEINDTVDLLSGHRSRLLGCIYNFARGNFGRDIQNSSGYGSYGYGNYGKYGKYGKYGQYGYGSTSGSHQSTAASASNQKRKQKGEES